MDNVWLTGMTTNNFFFSLLFYFVVVKFVFSIELIRCLFYGGACDRLVWHRFKSHLTSSNKYDNFISKSV